MNQTERSMMILFRNKKIKYWFFLILFVIVIYSVLPILANLDDSSWKNILLVYSLFHLYIAFPLCAFVYGSISYILTESVIKSQGVFAALHHMICAVYMLFDRLFRQVPLAYLFEETAETTPALLIMLVISTLGSLWSRYKTRDIE